MTSETKELGDTIIEVKGLVTVECSGNKSDGQWEQYEHEVVPGRYKLHEAELVEGVLYCLCDSIVSGKEIIFQPCDFEIIAP